MQPVYSNRRWAPLTSAVGKTLGISELIVIWTESARPGKLSSELKVRLLNDLGENGVGLVNLGASRLYPDHDTDYMPDEEIWQRRNWGFSALDIWSGNRNIAELCGGSVVETWIASNHSVDLSYMDPEEDDEKRNGEHQRAPATPNPSILGKSDKKSASSLGRLLIELRSELAIEGIGISRVRLSNQPSMDPFSDFWNLHLQGGLSIAATARGRSRSRLEAGHGPLAVAIAKWMRTHQPT